MRAAVRVLDSYSLISYFPTGRMSYADCFAAALAKLRKAELVTGDKEFKQVEGEVKVLWIA